MNSLTPLAQHLIDAGRGAIAVVNPDINRRTDRRLDLTHSDEQHGYVNTEIRPAVRDNPYSMLVHPAYRSH